MGRLMLYMSMSLDGFIAGPGDTKDNPAHDHLHRRSDAPRYCSSGSLVCDLR